MRLAPAATQRQFINMKAFGVVLLIVGAIIFYTSDHVTWPAWVCVFLGFGALGAGARKGG